MASGVEEGEQVSTPPFDTADARLLALVASQTPTAGPALDRAALITTLLDACAEVERLRAALAVAERAASLCAGEVAELRARAAGAEQPCPGSRGC